jgi:hypothetical protein
MPTDVAVTITIIVIGFIFFAGALAWADHYSNQREK